MAHKISEERRLAMRQKIIAGAKKYKNYLVDKEFKVICEDGSVNSLRFFPKDFQHLTGLLSDLSESDFFQRCYDKTISLQNILEEQKYDFKTLRFKTTKIENIEQIIYGNSKSSLFMFNLHTESRDYPVAIRNKDIDTCIGFRDNVHRPKTLRNYAKSNKADKEVEIVSIFAKDNRSREYTECVYLKNIVSYLKVLDKDTL